MTTNKSIDGLSTHGAKVKATSKDPVPKKSTKTTKIKVTKPKKVTVKKPSLEPIDTLAPATTASVTSASTASTAPASTPTPTTTETLTVKSEQVKTTNSDITNLEIAVSEDLSASATLPEPKEKPTPQVVEDFLSPVEAFNFDEAEKSMQKSQPKSKKQQQEEAKLDKQLEKVKKKPSKTRKIITSIALIIVLALIGVILWAIFWGNDIIAKITGGQGNIGDLLTFMDETYDPLKQDENGRTNILAFGTEGYDMEGNVGNGTHDGSQLTDSIMLISLDQATGDLAMVSIPRDLKVNNSCTSTGKINEIYWCNNMDKNSEAAGATALMDTVGTILGVDIQYYAHINWGSLVSIIDTLDGINITLDEDVSAYFGHYEAGVTYHVNGEAALAIARERHGASGGDFSRGASQQKILIGIKDRLLEKDLSITDMLSLVSALGDNLRTNFSISELKSLAHLTWEFDFNNMRTIALWPDYVTDGMINGISYVIPRRGAGNYGEIQSYIAKMLTGDPRKYESATIAILNSTDTAGLASSERSTLEKEGYTITYIGDTDLDFPNAYTIYDVNSGAPDTLALLEKYYNVTVQPYSALPVGLPLDYDILIILGGEPTKAEE